MAFREHDVTSRDFCYWLQGFLEISSAGSGTNPPVHAPLDGAKLDTIQRHLNLVFKHEIDPSFPQEQQAALDAAHAPPRPPPYHEPKIRC